MQLKSNWKETRQRFSAWWTGQNTDRPLIHLWAKRERPIGNPFPFEPYTDLSERYLNTEKMIAHRFELFNHYEPMAETYPELSLDMGAGSLALYMGSQPHFSADSLWFEPIEADYSVPGFLKLDPENHWYKTHLEMYKKAHEMIKGTDTIMSIPDMIEHLDTLASLRGTTDLCFDLFDSPEEVRAACETLNNHYKTCFDAFNVYCADETGGNSYTAFAIWGPGRTAKVQCDIAAVLSPELFREFAVPPLQDQCSWLDNSLFHLDGPECLCHVPALMEIEELNALQWTNGHNNPPAGEEIWDDLYRQVKEAGKGLWIALSDYEPEVAVSKADRLVRKFGAHGLYFLFPPMERKNADELLIKAERDWRT